MTDFGCTGVVLLGGASRRYGSDKAVALWDGKPMAQRVLEALAAAGLDPVGTLGGPTRNFGRPHWPDLHPGAGPLGGLLSAFQQASTPLVFLAACDLPLLRPETVQRVRSAMTDVALAATVAFTDRPEPLCACYRVSACAAAASEFFATGGRSLQKFLQGISHAYVELSDPMELTNVNSLGDHVT